MQCSRFGWCLLSSIAVPARSLMEMNERNHMVCVFVVFFTCATNRSLPLLHKLAKFFSISLASDFTERIQEATQIEPTFCFVFAWHRRCGTRVPLLSGRVAASCYILGGLPITLRRQPHCLAAGVAETLDPFPASVGLATRVTQAERIAFLSLTERHNDCSTTERTCPLWASFRLNRFVSAGRRPRRHAQNRHNSFVPFGEYFKC